MNRLAASVLLVALSILIYGLVTQIYPRYRDRLPGSIGPFTQTRSPYPLLRLGLYHLLRGLYYIGLPYLALRQGIIPDSLMGLGDWIATEDEIFKAIGLMLLAFLIIIMTWRHYTRTVVKENDRSPLGALDTDLIATTLKVLYSQIHWAFYRGAASLWLGGDYYTGIWLGFGLIVLEELLNPEIRRRLTLPNANITIGIGWGTASVSGVAFLFSRSLWLVGFFHWLIEMSGIAMRRKLNHAGSLGDDQMA